MPGMSGAYHEPLEEIGDDTRNLHRALVSLQEELEAIDWYRQRADACQDDALQAILLHNMREETEHACMLIEWLRRNSEDFARNLQTYLFTELPIAQVEQASEAGGSQSSAKSGFTVGPLKEDR